MRESKVQGTTVTYARQMGVWAQKFNSDGHKGVPDYLFLYNGKAMFIEFKATGEEATALQLDEHVEIRKRGIDVHVCDCPLKGITLINLFVV